MFRRMFTAPLYLFRSTIYISPPFFTHVKNLINLKIRKNSKEFGKGDLIRLKIRKSSKKFRKIDLIKSKIRRILHEFIERFVNIK
jgi:hypothetical protein